MSMSTDTSSNHPTYGLDYIEPEYRDGAVQILLDDKALEYLSVAGATSWFMQGGVLGNIAGIGQDVREHLTPGSITYEESLLPGGYDPHERIKIMDEEGIDVSILYPSLGLCWEEGLPPTPSSPPPTAAPITTG